MRAAHRRRGASAPPAGLGPAGRAGAARLRPGPAGPDRRRRGRDRRPETRSTRRARGRRRSSATRRRLDRAAGRRARRRGRGAGRPWPGDRRPAISSGPGATSTGPARRARSSGCSPTALLVGHRHRHRRAAPRGRRCTCAAAGCTGRPSRRLPELDTSAGRRRATSTGRRPARRPTSSGWSRSCWSCGPPSRPRCCAPAASACGNGPARPRRWTPTRPGWRCWPRPPTPPGCSAPGDDSSDSPRSGCRHRRTTGGWTSRSRPAGLALARAWLASTRVAGLVGSRDQRGPHASPPSAPTWTARSRPLVRAAVLADLAALPEGVASTTASLSARLRWQAPRRGGRLQDDLVELDDDARRRPSGWRPAARSPATAGCSPRATATARRPPSQRVLPEPLDHVLLQADLTAVAPGPLDPALARSLRLVADVESTGGATVYRFTEATVRRAFDAGLDGRRRDRAARPALADAGAAAAGLPGRGRRAAARPGPGGRRPRPSSAATTSRPSRCCSPTSGPPRCGCAGWRRRCWRRRRRRT